MFPELSFIMSATTGTLMKRFWIEKNRTYEKFSLGMHDLAPQVPNQQL